MRVLIVTAMYPTPNNPAFGIFVKEQVDSLIEAGINIDVLYFNNGKRNDIKGYLSAARMLRKKLREKPYDLVHAHYGLTGAVARMQFSHPLIVTFHGSDLIGTVNKQYQYGLHSKITTIISKFVSLTATRSIIVADKLRSKLWSTGRAITIPMGIDLSLFKPMPAPEARQQLGFSHDKKRILFLWPPPLPIKRFDVAQAAVQILQKAKVNIELLPVYTSPYQQIPLYMNACDALVLTSMHEASPCVIKEALACNLPIVSVDVGDVAERIDGVSGCYLCERTPQDVADKLHQALNHGRLTNGRDKIQEFSLQGTARKVIEVYKGVLASGR